MPPRSATSVSSWPGPQPLPNHRCWRNRARLRSPGPFIQEALKPARVEVLADVDVAAAVDGNGVGDVERSAPQALLAEARDDLHRPAFENPHVVVGAVDHIEEALLRIRREREARRRALKQRWFR